MVVSKTPSVDFSPRSAGVYEAVQGAVVITRRGFMASALGVAGSVVYSSAPIPTLRGGDGGRILSHYQRHLLVSGGEPPSGIIVPRAEFEEYRRGLVPPTSAVNMGPENLLFMGTVLLVWKDDGRDILCLWKWMWEEDKNWGIEEYVCTQ